MLCRCCRRDPCQCGDDCEAGVMLDGRPYRVTWLEPEDPDDVRERDRAAWNDIEIEERGR